MYFFLAANVPSCIYTMIEFMTNNLSMLVLIQSSTTKNIVKDYFPRHRDPNLTLTRLKTEESSILKNCLIYDVFYLAANIPSCASTMIKFMTNITLAYVPLNSVLNTSKNIVKDRRLRHRDPNVTLTRLQSTEHIKNLLTQQVPAHLK